VRGLAGQPTAAPSGRITSYLAARWIALQILTLGMGASREVMGRSANSSTNWQHSTILHIYSTDRITSCILTMDMEAAREVGRSGKSNTNRQHSTILST